MILTLLALVSALVFIWGLTGVIYPTAWHKKMGLGNRIRNTAVCAGAFILFAANGFLLSSQDDDAKQVVKQEHDWQSQIEMIATSNKTKTEKYDAVSLLARKYKPTEGEIKEFESYIINEFESGQYLQQIDDEEYMLANIFKSDIITVHYSKQDIPINNFAFDYLQNIKYTYRGVDAVDSEAVRSNERQMKKALAEME